MFCHKSKAYSTDFALVICTTHASYQGTVGMRRCVCLSAPLGSHSATDLHETWHTPLGSQKEEPSRLGPTFSQFLFQALQTDRQTNKQTDEQMDSTPMH